MTCPCARKGRAKHIRFLKPSQIFYDYDASLLSLFSSHLHHDAFPRPQSGRKSRHEPHPLCLQPPSPEILGVHEVELDRPLRPIDNFHLRERGRFRMYCGKAGSGDAGLFSMPAVIAGRWLTQGE